MSESGLRWRSRYDVYVYQKLLYDVYVIPKVRILPCGEKIENLQDEVTVTKTTLQLTQPQVSEQEPEGYTDEWIKEQFERTLMLTVIRKEGQENEPMTEAEWIKALRVFGNRVLMQFGDREGMYLAFSAA